MSMIKSPSSLNTRRSDVDPVFRAYQLQNTVGERKPIQNVIGKENSKGSLIESWKSKMDDLVSIVKDIPISITSISDGANRPKDKSSTPVEFKCKNKIIHSGAKPKRLALEVLSPATIKPCNVLKIEELMDAFRENPEAAENAIMLACRSGRLYPSEFRKLLEVFKSPSSRRNSIDVDMYSPFGTRISRQECCQDKSLEVTIGKCDSAAHCSVDTMDLVVEKPNIKITDVGKLLTILTADETLPPNSENLAQPVASAVSSRVLRTPNAKISEETPSKSAKKLSKSPKVSRFDAENLPVTPATSRTPKAASGKKSEIKSTPVVVLENSSEEEMMNPFAAAKKLNRTPPKSVMPDSEAPVEIPVEAPSEEPEAVPVVEMVSMQVEDIVENTAHPSREQELSLGDILHTTQMDISLTTAARRYSLQELEHVSNVIRRASAGQMEENLQATEPAQIEAPAEEVNSSSALAFLQAEVDRLKQELALRNVDEESFSSREIYRPAYSQLDADIEHIEQREQSLAKEQEQLHQIYINRIDRISSLKSELTQHELVRATTIRKQRLSLRKSDPTIFEKSFQADDQPTSDTAAVQPAVNPAGMPSNYAANPRDSAWRFSGATAPVNVYLEETAPSPSNILPFFSSPAQLVIPGLHAEDCRFFVPATRRPMATIYGDPANLTLVYAGRLPAAFQTDSRKRLLGGSAFERHGERKQVASQLQMPGASSSGSANSVWSRGSPVGKTRPDVAQLSPINDQPFASTFSPLLESYPADEGEHEIYLDHSQFDECSRLIEAEGVSMGKNHCESSHTAAISNKRKAAPSKKGVFDAQTGSMSSKYGSRMIFIPFPKEAYQTINLISPVEYDDLESDHEDGDVDAGMDRDVTSKRRNVSENASKNEAVSDNEKEVVKAVAKTKKEKPQRQPSKTARKTKKSSTVGNTGDEAAVICLPEPAVENSGATIKETPAVSPEVKAPKSPKKQSKKGSSAIVPVTKPSLALESNKSVPAADTMSVARPKSGYTHYCQMTLPLLREKHSDKSELDLVQMCSTQWKKLSAADKSLWNASAKSELLTSSSSSSSATSSSSSSTSAAGAVSGSAPGRANHKRSAPADDAPQRITETEQPIEAPSVKKSKRVVVKEVKTAQLPVTAPVEIATEDDADCAALFDSKKATKKQKKAVVKKVVANVEQSTSSSKPRASDSVSAAPTSIPPTEEESAEPLPTKKTAKRKAGVVQSAVELEGGGADAIVVADKRPAAEPVAKAEFVPPAPIAPTQKPKPAPSHSATATASLFKAQEMLNSSAMSNNSSISKPSSKFMLPKLLKKR